MFAILAAAVSVTAGRAAAGPLHTRALDGWGPGGIQLYVEGGQFKCDASIWNDTDDYQELNIIGQLARYEGGVTPTVINTSEVMGPGEGYTTTGSLTIGEPGRYICSANLYYGGELVGYYDDVIDIQ
jgi:hypothetical protein